MCDEPKGGGWIPREWEAVGTELGEAGRLYHVRLRVVGSLGVCYGEWSVCVCGGVRKLETLERIFHRTKEIKITWKTYICIY